MFQQARFQLVNITSTPAKMRLSSKGYFSMGYQAGIIVLFRPDTSEEEIMKNEKVCRLLKDRVGRSLCVPGVHPKDYEDLSVKFDVLDGKQPKTTANVTVEGVVLAHMTAEMSYSEPSACLKLKMSAVLEGTDWKYDSTARIPYETDLVPSIKDGKYFHKVYVGHVTPINISGAEERFNRKSWKWELTDVCLWVEGLNYAPLPTHVEEVMESIQETELGSEEVNILFKKSKFEDGNGVAIQEVDDDNLPILVSQEILSKQSTFIRTRLADQSKFVEGSTLQFDMTSWTKREVLAFLDFLEHGNVEKAVSDPYLAISLYKMSTMYQIKRLKPLMKSMLLRMPANLFGSDLHTPLLDLFKVTMRLPEVQPTTDLELNKMASDILCTIIPVWDITTKGLRKQPPLGHAFTQGSRRFLKMMHFP